MKILVTGAAGFIGFHLVRRLTERGDEVVGLDSLNDYYDRRMKFGRLAAAGVVESEVAPQRMVQSSRYAGYRFVQMALEEREALERLFAEERFDVVVNLAAQAGVRYSIENPHAYAQSNVVGFLNLLESCRHNSVRHLVYASSSSVYGRNAKVPFSEEDRTDSPVSLYAATKKANELMAHTYSSLYALPTTGLRFFTVYGSWGRPDMAPMLFADAITEGRPIKVFNGGDLSRDFTYIDDITEGVVRVVTGEVPTGEVPCKIYNIGCSTPVRLMDFISTMERAFGREAEKVMLPMQAGDVYQTYADTSLLERDFGYRPSTTLEEGIGRFVEWYVTENPLRR
ncbi:MAG: NAD-dependent epimerase [Rikenellaceae bacterium]|nr:NAD-dependent epimerase [Rikenellaceae bacterium]